MLYNIRFRNTYDRIRAKKELYFGTPYLYDPMNVRIKNKRGILDVSELGVVMLVESFRLRYGIGNGISGYICRYSGYHEKLQYKYVRNTECIQLLEQLFSRMRDNLDVYQERKSFHDISKQVILFLYRGRRHRHGYPTRGQRTRTNYKTSTHLMMVRMPRVIKTIEEWSALEEKEKARESQEQPVDDHNLA